MGGGWEPGVEGGTCASGAAVGAMEGLSGFDSGAWISGRVGTDGIEIEVMDPVLMGGSGVMASSGTLAAGSGGVAMAERGRGAWTSAGFGPIFFQRKKTAAATKRNTTTMTKTIPFLVPEAVTATGAP